MNLEATLQALRQHHEHVRAEYERQLCQLVKKIRGAGFVATVETVPTDSPAMGYYHINVDVRLGRRQYQAEMTLEDAVKAQAERAKEQP